MSTASQYIIAIGENVKDKGEDACLGKVRADFKGKLFFFYDNNANPKKALINEAIRE